MCVRQNSVEALGREWRREAVLSGMRRLGGGRGKRRLGVKALRWSKWRGVKSFATVSKFPRGAAANGASSQAVRRREQAEERTSPAELGRHLSKRC